MPTVRPATPADLDAMGRSLAAAFADDPVWAWVANPKGDWDRLAARWFAKEAALQLRGHGRVLVDDDVHGAALWAPPGKWRSTLLEGLKLTLPSLRLFGPRLVRGLRMIAAIEREHPRDEHWYLALLGTDPQHQGGGVGSALIRQVTDECDEQGLPAYLESSKESNVPFYGRHGFEVTGVIDLPGGGPRLWKMRREPKG